MNEEVMDIQQEEQEQEESKTYSQDEVLAIIQSEADKRVQQALRTQQKKFEKELSKQKSLSQLDETERARAEKDMRIQELEEKLKEFELTQSKSEVMKVLGSRGLSTELIDVLSITGDSEADQATIDKLDKIFKNMVKTEVEKRMGSTSTKVGTVGLDGNISREQFKKMSLSEQAQLYENNRELYLKLIR